jgi:dTMP kinase
LFSIETYRLKSMLQKMPRGALIVLEGCDKSGKTTQCRKLVQHLTDMGRKAELWRFPERSTAIGSVINDYIARKCELEDRAIHLLFAANRWEMTPKMKEKLNEGVTLIVDRYAYSGVAFTAAKGLDMEWCKTCDRGLPRPDAVFYLDIDIEDASVRGDFGGERYEVADFQKKVQKFFRTLEDDSWKTVDARRSIEDIHSDLCANVVEVMEKYKNKPMEKLWQKIDDEKENMNGNV